MAKRLYMTGADYLAIAVSPALIMLLVGSLVFFLIEVLYAGEYQARLNYVFALFVFATVLIARISIEMGSERAAIYSIPLGLATFVVLQKFVEHPSAFSPLINIMLIVVVWWCAHKLTWNCTLIDDSQDASGEGLMQLAGVDDADVPQHPTTKPANQLLPEGELPSTWERLFSFETGPHAPGLWVLYFSLAALPIFGIGQGFIPTADTTGRRYAFVLLFVYVASGLLLLVTTSFLGFRRYLRQRGVDMPNPMAATWVGVGGVLTAIVLLLAMLLPRPNAEFAVAQPPWQARSPEGLTSSRYGRGNDGAETGEPSSESVTSENPKAPSGNTTQEQSPGRPPGEASSDGTQASDSGEQGGQGQTADSSQSSQPSDESGSLDSSSQAKNENPATDEAGERSSQDESASEGSDQANGEPQSAERQRSPDASPSREGESTDQRQVQLPEQAADSRIEAVQVLQNALGGIAGLIKWLFYLALAVLSAYLLWKFRRELVSAARDLWRDLKALLARLFGHDTSESHETEAELAAPLRTRKRFRDFQNPFTGNDYKNTSPEELVRYTFEAFEAWSVDRGEPRRADQTPLEFVQTVSRASGEMHRTLHDFCRLYSCVAYGGVKVSTADVGVLRQLWAHMDTSSSAALVGSLGD